ncbi:MAG: MBOAT family protein [Lachnospiraceae bacterium]|nr:MBOAT family protein [Lachnospiraceae bacterium]
MVFSSITFLLYFFPLVWIVYRFVPARAKNAVLVAASLVFYAWGEPVYLLLMLLSIGMNYLFGRWIGRAREEGMKAGALKLHLALAVAANLGFLFFFKYAGFLFSVFSPKNAPVIALPVGISFYTFQALSYVVDVYREKVKPRQDLLSFALYISFFPQLIAGPIVQYKVIEEQLDDHPLKKRMFSDGLWLFIWGLAKKVLIANAMGEMFELCREGGGIVTAWLGAIAFALQIYYDFSGYSDMAIGIGRMFGFRFPKNFDAPYTSRSVTEFWRRWHMTLGSWFREYVYIPLGGNRVSVAKHIRNLLVVWLLTGIWHGAGWNFIIWGLYYGAWLIVEKYLIGKWLEKHRVLGLFYTMLIVLLGWMIFAITDMGELGRYLLSMIGFSRGEGGATVRTLLTSYGVVMAIGAAGIVPWVSRLRNVVYQKSKVITFIIEIVLFVLCLAALIRDSYNPFLYFRF